MEMYNRKLKKLRSSITLFDISIKAYYIYMYLSRRFVGALTPILLCAVLWMCLYVYARVSLSLRGEKIYVFQTHLFRK